jgi:Rod binding domain-containing protein
LKIRSQQTTLEKTGMDKLKQFETLFVYMFLGHIRDAMNDTNYVVTHDLQKNVIKIVGDATLSIEVKTHQKNVFESSD